MTPTLPFPWIEPMRATLSDRRFSDPDWIFEPKLDGVRCLAYRSDDVVVLVSRNGNVLNDTYPEVVDAVAAQPATSFVLDGEVVAFDGDRPSFSRLQQRMGVADADVARRRGVPVTYVVFDVPQLQGVDLRAEPLATRRQVLAGSFEFGDALALNAAVVGDGEALFEALRDRGWEGVMAKRADAAYVSTRSSAWLKWKVEQRQELVVGGFTDPKGGRAWFGALLLGVYDGDALRYAGKVGSGFDDATLTRLGPVLAGIEADTSPFADPVPRVPGAHWVRPDLVAEVAFGEWTDGGQLRHPRFKGMRDDKDPRSVRRERPVSPDPT